MRPADVFLPLWDLATADLEAALLERHGLRLGVSLILFRTRGPHDPSAAYDQRGPFIQLYVSEDRWDEIGWSAGEDRPPAVCRDDEAINLAHEHGHFCSDREKQQSPEYLAAVLRFDKLRVGEAGNPWTDAEQDLIEAEEARAWSNARKTLARLGVDEWGVVDAMEADAKQAYARLFAQCRAA